MPTFLSRWGLQVGNPGDNSSGTDITYHCWVFLRLFGLLCASTHYIRDIYSSPRAFLCVCGSVSITPAWSGAVATIWISSMSRLFPGVVHFAVIEVDGLSARAVRGVDGRHVSTVQLHRHSATLRAVAEMSEGSSTWFACIF